MRFLSADLLFPIITPAVNGKVLVIDEIGKIIEIVDKEGIDPLRIENFHGALIPGFVNTHCHLELSISKINSQNRTQTDLPRRAICLF